MDISSRFELAVQRIIDNAAARNWITQDHILRVAVAFSGGLDSVALLNLCTDYARRHAINLMAFHVHHGLSPHADQWVLHCRNCCMQFAIPFEVTYVQLGSTRQDGVEGTARKKRYAALGALCEQYQIDLLLTAHHQDDQAETMLLQLLRGSGIAGIRGMQQCHHATDLFENDHLLLARPLLDFSRAELEQYCSENQLIHIEDESNADTRYARNALRTQIMPVLARYFPGFQSRFARTAQHAQSGLELIEQFAQQDYESCRVNSPFAQLDAVRLQMLPDARIDNVLRYWIARHGAQMPSSARLAEMRKQLMHARDDAQVCVRHGEIELHRYRQQLGIAGCARPVPQTQQFIWTGEGSMRFPAFGGTLFFDPVSSSEHKGIHRDWLMGKSLEMRLRQGGERLKLSVNRPTRTMKSHYQTLGIPYWQRERLPFVFNAGDLLFAAGVGTQTQFISTGPDCVILRWQAE